MKAIATAELVEKITATGKTLAELKAASRAQVDADGSCARINVLPGLVVVWIGNKNYQGGRRNGYGAGLYAIATVNRAMANTWLLAAEAAVAVK